MRSRSARERTKQTKTSSSALPRATSLVVTPVGRGPSVCAKSLGAAHDPKRALIAMPSFFVSGVPE